MSSPGQSPSQKWSDETVAQPAGAEGYSKPVLEEQRGHELYQGVMPPATRYLDETGESPMSPFGSWQDTWIKGT